MKRYLLIGFILVLFIVSCGAPPEEAKTEVKSLETKGAADIAYQTLTESELQRFLKAFPIAKTEMERLGDKFEGSEDISDWEGFLLQFSTMNKEITGLDAKLKVAGMPWEEFWPAFAKTWMASVAVMLNEEMGEMEEGMKELEARLKNPKVSAAEKEMMEGAKKAMGTFKELYDKVPQANKDLVKKHWAELSKIMEIED